MIWSWVALGCGGVLLVWLNVWYYRLPKAERDENERDLWIW